MKVEIRNDSVNISGYVNTVERESKVLHDRNGTPFVEKIKAGAFTRALRRNNSVKLLLNHNNERVLGATNKNLTLTEDNIGLRAVATITDPEVVEKAKKGQLSGWSFGFISLRDVKDKDEKRNLETRDVTELELLEVSILDNTKVPAYSGTLIEARELAHDDELIEIRIDEATVETVDNTETIKQEKEEKKEVTNVYKFKNEYYRNSLKTKEV